MATNVVAAVQTADAAPGAAPYKISRDPAYDDVTVTVTATDDAARPVVGYELEVAVPVPATEPAGLNGGRMIRKRIQRASTLRRANATDLASAGNWSLPNATALVLGFIYDDLGSGLADGDRAASVFVLVDGGGWVS